MPLRYVSGVVLSFHTLQSRLSRYSTVKRRKQGSRDMHRLPSVADITVTVRRHDRSPEVNQCNGEPSLIGDLEIPFSANRRDIGWDM